MFPVVYFQEDSLPIELPGFCSGEDSDEAPSSLVLLLYPSQHFDLSSIQTKPQESIFFMLCQAGSSVLSAQTRPASPPQQSGSGCFLVLPPVCPLTRLFRSCWPTGASATASDKSSVSVNACRCLNEAIIFANVLWMEYSSRLEMRHCLPHSLVSSRCRLFCSELTFRRATYCITRLWLTTLARWLEPEPDTRVTTPSNPKSCRICHLNSWEIKCNLSNTTGGSRKGSQGVTRFNPWERNSTVAP